jgi:glutamate synthase (NADPH/NADH) small chain
MQISSFETRAEYRRVAQDDEEKRSRVSGALVLMGKITGFLEIDRRDRKYAPVAERVKSYQEFVIPLSEKDTRDQAARCMNCGIPYCHGTGSVAPGTPGCPVNNQIPDFNDLVYAGNWEEASRNLHSTNNFPEFTGRICPAPCEASCTLNIDDNPVTIKTIECAIVDRAWDNGWINPEIPATKTGKKVAVIGSGPAARSSWRAPATTCICSRNSPRLVGCCVTAFPTSRWRSTSSTAA